MQILNWLGKVIDDWITLFRLVRSRCRRPFWRIQLQQCVQLVFFVRLFKWVD